MDLSGIISISGKPGLYKIIGNSTNGIIVEQLATGKRMPAHATHKISALDDIAIYTVEEDKPLGEVYAAIWEKTDGKKGPDHKDSVKELRTYLGEVLPNYDDERVYDSDVKKLFQWFNLLHDAGELKERMEESKDEDDSSDKETDSAEASSEKE